MGPRANFACLAARCQQDGAASIYELPIAATRCPVCGSKRIRRLYDSINISSGLAKATDRLVEPAYAQATAGVDSAKRAERQNGPALAVPMSQIGGALAKLGIAGMSLSATDGKAVAVRRPPSGAFTPFQSQAPRPQIVARDTEFAVKRRADGTPVASRA